MQLTMFDLPVESSPPSSSGKTSLESYRPKTMLSGAFWLALPEKMTRSSRQGEDGRTVVVCMDPKGQSLGGPWTPNTLEWPNDAVVCSLSQVLETGLIHPRFFLSGTACAGILRRAEKRGKSLPPSLHAALEAVAHVPAIAFSSKDYGNDATTDLSPTLRSLGTYNANGGGNMAVAFNARQGPDHWYDRTGPLDTDGSTQAVAVSLRGREGGATAELGDEVGNCLRASGGGGDKAHVLAAMSVRRLTPVECERLQGFPDNYSQIPWRKKPASECPDGPRYKALGNSWAVPVVQWIGRRIHNATRRSK